MTTDSFTLRPISLGDAAAAAALIRETFGAIDPPLAPPPSALRETAESLSTQIAAGGGMVAEARAAPLPALIGVVLWGERAGGLYVGRLSVAPPWRRCGVAAALVRAAEDAARTLGFTRMHLGVRLALHGNRRLFAGLGFCETVQHAHDGFDAPTWVEMEKQLL